MKLWKALFDRHAKSAPADLQDELEQAAGRFVQWAENEGVTITTTSGDSGRAEELFLRLRKELVQDIPEQIASDFAAYLGETIRRSFRGDWIDHELLGIVLRNVDGLPGAAFVPLAMVEKKWELGQNLSISKFMETFPARLEQERRSLDYLVAQKNDPAHLVEQMSRVEGETANELALSKARSFVKWWHERFNVTLPLTLQGVRETERFLRSQFFFISLHEETLIEMGFFLGEVTRGLFQGEWDFDEVRHEKSAAKAALKWPELSYYPVGKVYKFITERPEGESFDEYVRLVPSARKAVSQ